MKMQIKYLVLDNGTYLFELSGHFGIRIGAGILGLQNSLTTCKIPDFTTLAHVMLFSLRKMILF